MQTTRSCSERDRSRIDARCRKGSVGRAASLVSPGPLARPCPAGRDARVGRLFQEQFRSEEQPDAKPPKPTQRRDHYQELTDRIVAALEAGVAPWRRPWDPNACGGS